MTEPCHNNQTTQSIACAIFTISDTRTKQNDDSGALIQQRLQSANHTILTYEIIPDDRNHVHQAAKQASENPSCQAVLLTGGTGIAMRDTTIEAITPFIEKHLDGFGELFRMLSYQQIGSPAMLSRAVAGIHQSTILFAMPGSTAAVKLAMDRLIIPELPHIIALLELH